MKNKKSIKFMSKVSKDIISIEINKEDSIEKIFKKFYSIMRKYGIKRGTKNKNGITQNNFEWTICTSLFLKQIQNGLDWGFLLWDYPKDLRHY